MTFGGLVWGRALGRSRRIEETGLQRRRIERLTGKRTGGTDKMAGERKEEVSGRVDRQATVGWSRRADGRVV